MIAVKRKLGSVMIVDDNATDNLDNALLIRQAGCSDRVVIYNDASQALAALRNCARPNGHQPDLIFLDFHMFGIQSWEFAKALKTVPDRDGYPTPVFLLTSSYNLYDIAAMDSIPFITDFYIKPLKENTLQDILETHFPAYL